MSVFQRFIDNYGTDTPVSSDKIKRCLQRNRESIEKKYPNATDYSVIVEVSEMWDSTNGCYYKERKQDTFRLYVDGNAVLIN